MHSARIAIVIVLTMIASGQCAQGSSDLVDLSSYPPPDSVWRCANSTISSRKDPDGTIIWRWEIKNGGEAFLWLNESLPIHNDLPSYQRLIYDVNIAEGQINHF